MDLSVWKARGTAYRRAFVMTMFRQSRDIGTLHALAAIASG